MPADHVNTGKIMTHLDDKLHGHKFGYVEFAIGGERPLSALLSLVIARVPFTVAHTTFTLADLPQLDRLVCK